jgi:hypothetical protein
MSGHDHQRKPPPPRRGRKPGPARPDTTLYLKTKTPGGAVKYVPHSEIFDGAIGHGTWLVTCGPGSTRWRRLDEQPAVVELLAAAERAREAMQRAMMDRSKWEPARRHSTPREQRAWAAYCRELGHEGTMCLQSACAQDVVEAGIAALLAAAQKCRLTDEDLGATV